MATSNQYNYNPTVGDIVKDALSNLGIIGLGETPDNDMESMALSRLEKLLKALQNDMVIVNRFSTQSAATTPQQATVDISTYGFKRIYDVVIKQNNVDTPLTIIPEETYLEIPEKTTAGIPLYCVVSSDESTLKLYPVPDSAYTLSVYGQLKIEDAVAMTSNLSIDSGAYEMLVTMLTHKLASAFRKPLDERLYWGKLADKELSRYKAGQYSTSPNKIKVPVGVV